MIQWKENNKIELISEQEKNSRLLKFFNSKSEDIKSGRAIKTEFIWKYVS